jgi:hypothetical protein
MIATLRKLFSLLPDLLGRAQGDAIKEIASTITGIRDLEFIKDSYQGTREEGKAIFISIKSVDVAPYVVC